jgi:hypothetical protein
LFAVHTGTKKDFVKSVNLAALLILNGFIPEGRKTKQANKKKGIEPFISKIKLFFFQISNLQCF